MIGTEDLYRSPNALAKFYTRFGVGKRCLLTGHSHQAWPDRALDGQCLAWEDAAAHVDDKWQRAFAKADRVRRGFSRLLDDSSGQMALGANTHELIIRFLSALPLRVRPRLVTTDGEYHTIRRQLDRLAEEEIEIVRVAADPASTLAERLVAALNDRTAAVMVSRVLFRNGHIVSGLGKVLDACRKVGAELLVDVYHALNVIPVCLEAEGLKEAYVVGGGYKYCQLGEGNCFLRLPEHCAMRPVITGWFSEFGALSEPQSGNRVNYGPGPARFAGATYDPTSHYRAAEVFDFFAEQELTPRFLREVSRHQIDLLARLFDELDADPELITRDRSVSLDRIGGFLALRSPRAGDLARLLKSRGVLTDSRGDSLRLGPAPYLSDEQLAVAMEVLGDIIRSIGKGTEFPVRGP